MISAPMDVLRMFPIRKTKKQKAAFREAVVAFAQNNGYDVHIEQERLGARNIIIGNQEKAKFLVSAHYDTPASIGIPNFVTPCNLFLFLVFQLVVVGALLGVAVGVGYGVWALSHDSDLSYYAAYFTYIGIFVLMMVGPANRNNANDNTSGVVSLLEIMVSLPRNSRDQVCFVLFDLEEAGLVGSSSYRKRHTAQTDRQIILNMDCVGDGDVIMLFPTPKLRKQPEKMEMLRSLCKNCGEKSIRLHEKGFAYCPSDQRNFPYGVGIMAFREKKGIGIYCDRIHTWRDTILEPTNVNVLRAALITLVSRENVN